MSFETASPAELAEQAARQTPAPTRCDPCIVGDHDRCDPVVCRGCDHDGKRPPRHGTFAGSWGIEGGTVDEGRKP